MTRTTKEQLIEFAGDEPEERELFETWARSIGKTDRDLQRGGWDGRQGEYAWKTELQMWQAFQAGRASKVTP